MLIGRPYEKMEFRIEYLLTGESKTVEVHEESIRSTKQWIISSIEDMRMLLDNDGLNQPNGFELFSPEPSPAKCKACSYKGICT